MESIKTLPDEEAFEELFKDRFSENDAKFMEIKSNNCPIPPPVVYPWKIPGKIFHKKWDYGSGQQDRGHSRYDRSRHDSGRNKYDSDRHRSNSHHSYRDRSGDRDRRSHRGERDNSSSQNRDEKNSRDYNRYSEKNHR